MSDADVSALVFNSGFTTRERTTRTSGRGVGLDIVRAQVEGLRGRIELSSAPGQGARFTITLPSNMGSSPIVLVRCARQNLAIPLQAVESVVAIGAESLVRCADGAVLEHRGRRLRLEDLGGLLGLRVALLEGDREPAVIVRGQDRHVAVRVDEVIGDLDVRIRPLPDEIRDNPAYDGAAMLPNGELVLVLRPDWVATAQASADAFAREGRRALVVDDSLTARAVHRSMLEAGGYSVHTAASAAEALAQLARAAYDVLVCDLHMEPTDGAELTATVRSLPEQRRLPVLLVSAFDSPRDRGRALDAGADAFLSKAECAEGRLLGEVAAVLTRRGSTPP
jgi:CheY-like chemotaxis protein